MDPEFLVKEIDLGPIEGGDEREIVEAWRMTAGDNATSPTAQLYRNGERHNIGQAFRTPEEAALCIARLLVS